MLKESTGVEQTEYLDGFQYQKGKLQFFPTAEGYVDATDGNYKYVFQYKDHLGNIRVSYTQNGGTLKILEENHYYPFGLKHEKYNSAIFDYILTGGTSSLNNVARSKNQFKYNGQEFQDELELNMTAMDFRQYDNALGRFHGVDLLAELAPSMTPYRFGFNNPVYWSDPSGLFETIAAARAYMDSQGISSNAYYISPDGKGGFNVHYKSMVIEDPFADDIGGELSEVEVVNGGGINPSNGFKGSWGFVYGFVAASGSDFNSVSAWTGYAGLQATKYEEMLRRIAETSADNASSIKAAGILKTAGRVLGVAGAIATGIEGAQDGHISTGDVVKVAIGIITTFTPYGWVYGVIDLGVGIVTGATLSDRIGNAIDNY